MQRDVDMYLCMCMWCGVVWCGVCVCVCVCVCGWYVCVIAYTDVFTYFCESM